MNPLIRIVLGAAIGAALGFVLYKFIGCRSGACPLTGNPWIAMTIWGIAGALMGAGKI